MNKMFLKTILSAVLTMSAVLVLVAAPKSEAQFDRLVKTYTLNPDGSQEFRVQKQLTIYTHAAMNSLYGETFIVYDPSYQELKINDSYTRQADGPLSGPLRMPLWKYCRLRQPTLLHTMA